MVLSIADIYAISTKPTTGVRAGPDYVLFTSVWMCSGFPAGVEYWLVSAFFNVTTLLPASLKLNSRQRPISLRKPFSSVILVLFLWLHGIGESHCEFWTLCLTILPTSLAVLKLTFLCMVDEKWFPCCGVRDWQSDLNTFRTALCILRLNATAMRGLMVWAMEQNTCAIALKSVLCRPRLSHTRCAIIKGK